VLQRGQQGVEYRWAEQNAGEQLTKDRGLADPAQELAQ